MSKNRAIKLRVWDAENRRFIPLTCLSELERATEFTGVLDAFGREIWEGDIVQWSHFDATTDNYYECYFLVSFLGGWFWHLWSG